MAWRWRAKGVTPATFGFDHVIVSTSSTWIRFDEYRVERSPAKPPCVGIADAPPKTKMHRPTATAVCPYSGPGRIPAVGGSIQLIEVVSRTWRSPSTRPKAAPPMT